MFTAAVLFVAAVMSSYAAPSPQTEEYITATTIDGVEVILWRMPDYLYKLSDKAKSKYQMFLPLEPGEVLYLGEVPEGKFKGSLMLLLEDNSIEETSVASAAGMVLQAPHGVFLLSSGMGIKAADIMKSAGRKLADNSSATPEVSPVDEIRDELDAANEEINRAGSNLQQLKPEIAQKAAQAGVPIEDCKVTEVFDLSVFKDTEELEKATNIGRVCVSIKVVGKNIENLVCLLHRNKAQWEIVEDVKTNKDVLTFWVDTMSPFAVVTWGNEGLGTGPRQSPKTGDATLAWAGAAAAVVMLSAAAFVLSSAAKKKRQ